MVYGKMDDMVDFSGFILWGGCMRWVLILCVILFGLIPDVGALPYGNPCSMGIFEPSGWSVRETPSCPYGYQCYYDAYVPSITINLPMWIFGVRNNAQCGGILNFRRYPVIRV
jgi:hypothetical protein